MYENIYLYKLFILHNKYKYDSYFKKHTTEAIWLFVHFLKNSMNRYPIDIHCSFFCCFIVVIVILMHYYKIFHSKYIFFIVFVYLYVLQNYLVVCSLYCHNIFYLCVCVHAQNYLIAVQLNLFILMTNAF